MQKKFLTIALLAFTFVALIVSPTLAQQTPNPPATISGTADQVTGLSVGDPTTNGASVVSATGIAFNGTNKKLPTGLAGTGKVSGDVTASSVTNPTASHASFTGSGLAAVNLNPGKKGTGTIELTGNLAGGAISTLGDCSSGSCAGSAVTSNLTLDLSKDTKGKPVGGNAVMVTTGATSAKLGANSASSSASVSAGLCLTPTQNPTPAPPCGEKGCGKN